MGRSTFTMTNWGGDQHLGQPNVERTIFRNLEISNIKRTKDELLNFFIFEFVFL